MDNNKKPLVILNLAGELSIELAQYFNTRNIRLINFIEEGSDQKWTHILTRDIQYFEVVRETYNLDKNGGNIISLTKVDDLKNFTQNLGNLIVDDSWFKGAMGIFILDKYFQGYGGVHLGDNYPSFKEQGSFAVVNPFSTGDSVDRLVQKSFESGVEALSIKTFFDHIVMYIAALKNKNKVGLPIEVTYGAYEDIFAVQLHFYSDKLRLSDITASLSSAVKKNADEYLLNVTAQASDFFDVSYLPEVKKVMITGLWSKDKRVNFENRGFMLMDILRDAPVLPAQDYDSDGIITFKDDPILDHTDKITVSGDSQEDKSSVTVSGLMDEDNSAVTVSGHTEEEHSSTVVSENQELTEDEIKILKGDDELLELVQTIKGKFEKDKSVMRFSGEGFDLDEIAFKIASNVENSSQEQNLRVRSLIDKLPEKIKTGLFDFAKTINKELNDLNEKDLSDFHLLRMPEIIQAELQEAATLAEAQVAVPVINNTKVKLLEAELGITKNDNEKLKTHIKALNTEVRILKEARKKLAESHMKAAMATSQVAAKKDDSDEALRAEFQQKLNTQKVLNEMEMKKLASLLEREAKLITDLKQEEMKSRKLQLEGTQKDNIFSQEIEKAERQIKSKELLVIKTKETFTKLSQKKDQELADYKSKIIQLESALANSSTNTNTIVIKELEKQNQHMAKQLEFHKNKVASLMANMQPTKTDTNFKEEARKLQMMCQQLKNHIEVSKTENEKLSARIVSDATQITSLRQEKVKLEGLLKKATLEALESPALPSNSGMDHEAKRLMAQNQILENQLREQAQKISTLESKLNEAMKPQRLLGGGDETSKVKLNQLENSVKKLTQDLVENRNQLSDAKKETNKLRQEKTALQNQIDKLKKDADKSKPAAPKKSGKAA